MSGVLSNLTEYERQTFQETYVFLNKRLESNETLDWALRIKPHEKIKKLALIESVERQVGNDISEPWRSTWLLIKEAIESTPNLQEDSYTIFLINKRLKQGERSLHLISQIVDLIRPRFEVKAFSKLELHYKKKKKKPQTPQDLFSISLKSGKLLDSKQLLNNKFDAEFLFTLGLSIDSAVFEGLERAKQIGWDNSFQFWRLGELRSIRSSDDPKDDPDKYNNGIAPSVKLLFSVVSKLKDLDPIRAAEFARRWKFIKSPIYLRLWAALSIDPRLFKSDLLGECLIELDDLSFWNIYNNYPEISQIRSKRFVELDKKHQLILIKRLKKGPPRNLWSKKLDSIQLKKLRLEMAWKELRKIEIEGFEFSSSIKKWLLNLPNLIPELLSFDPSYEEAVISTESFEINNNPDQKYNFLSGVERLKALESAITSSRSSWFDDASRAASSWIQVPSNQILLVNDITESTRGGSDFPNVWETFGWANSPDKTTFSSDSEKVKFIKLVLKNLLNLSDTTIREAIHGITHWISSWDKLLISVEESITLWKKIWPIAVDTTNTLPPDEEEIFYSPLNTQNVIEEIKSPDTLNNPVGKMVGYFLSYCPKLNENENVFEQNKNLKMMRDTIIRAKHKSGLIAKHRLLEGISYFLMADREWTNENLLSPLRSNDVESLALWNAIARSRPTFKLLTIIGDQMIEKANDKLLLRDTRKALVFILILETLFAFKDNREPSVPNVRIVQMIRNLDDEVRAHAADILSKFIRDLSNEKPENIREEFAKSLFYKSVLPFLKRVWPQERSLSMPGVSKALSDLPASSPGSFVDAVYAIEPYLVPFDCWSLNELGFRDNDWETKFTIIDTHEKAEAFLRLLDCIIGNSEAAIIPTDLSGALDKIKKISPRLIESASYKRLLANARSV